MSDESRARSLLHAMQARLAEGPYAALGLPTHASPSDIRTAWLQLTKQFHPARFARMASEIQKLSNEVFLSLKSAHEQVARAQPTKPSGRSASTTGSPIVKDPNRPPTRPFGVPITPATKPGVPPTQARTPAPSGQSQPIPTTRQSGPIPRPLQPAAPAQPAQPASRQSQPIKVATLAATPTAPVRGPNTPPGPAPAAVRAVASSSTMETLDPVLAPFLELLGRGEWDRAQAQIDALVTRNPQNKKYAAYAAYARARRAMAEGDLRGAGIELNQALGLDPQNELAKSAISQLMRRK
jgi:hypothetical protein